MNLTQLEELNQQLENLFVCLKGLSLMMADLHQATVALSSQVIVLVDKVNDLKVTGNDNQ